jgi:hypothetical protein
MLFSNFSICVTAIMQLVSQLLVNAVTGEVKTEQKHLSGNATYQESGAERLVGNSELEIRP